MGSLLPMVFETETETVAESETEAETESESETEAETEAETESEAETEYSYPSRVPWRAGHWSDTSAMFLDDPYSTPEYRAGSAPPRV